MFCYKNPCPEVVQTKFTLSTCILVVQLQNKSHTYFSSLSDSINKIKNVRTICIFKTSCNICCDPNPPPLEASFGHMTRWEFINYNFHLPLSELSGINSWSGSRNKLGQNPFETFGQSLVDTNVPFFGWQGRCQPLCSLDIKHSKLRNSPPPSYQQTLIREFTYLWVSTPARPSIFLYLCLFLCSLL